MITDSVRIIAASVAAALVVGAVAAGTYTFSARKVASPEANGHVSLGVSMVAKNQTWPIKGHKFQQPCASEVCVEL